MTDQNEQAKQQLLTLLEKKQAVLMVGAGSSNRVDYPLWSELVEIMRTEFASGIDLSGIPDPAAALAKIKEQASLQSKVRAYYKRIERLFQPRLDQPNCSIFHHALIQLGFSGIVTTNYDLVLETAIDEVQHKGSFRTEPIDLCDEGKAYRVLEFLRTISPAAKFHKVLHLHGLYSNPDKVILTQDDYFRAYGKVGTGKLDDDIDLLKKEVESLKDNGTLTPTAYQQYLALRKMVTAQILDTIHRKVIWALLTMHPVVFVGFSMGDPPFMRMLDVVHEDFQQDSEKIHYAILGYTDESQKERFEVELGPRGVQPVFYSVIKKPDPGGGQDHGAVEQLILDFSRARGISLENRPISELNKRMLEL